MREVPNTFHYRRRTSSRKEIVTSPLWYFFGVDIRGDLERKALRNAGAIDNRDKIIDPEAMVPIENSSLIALPYHILRKQPKKTNASTVHNPPYLTPNFQQQTDNQIRNQIIRPIVRTNEVAQDRPNINQSENLDQRLIDDILNDYQEQVINRMLAEQFAYEYDDDGTISYSSLINSAPYAYARPYQQNSLPIPNNPVINIQNNLNRDDAISPSLAKNPYSFHHNDNAYQLTRALEIDDENIKPSTNVSLSTNNRIKTRETYGSIFLNFIHRDLFTPDLEILQKSILKEYDTPIAKGLNNLSTQSTFNFNFQNYNELEINQFFSHSYRYFSDMPNELKMMFASNGEWRNYCLTFAGNLPTNQLLNSLNEIFTSLSRLKSPIKNEIVFKALIDIAKKGELAECVGGSIIRILPLIHMDYIFNYVYYYYKEKLANLILSNDTGKRLVPRADEAHLIIYLDHLLMNIPIEKIKFRDARASHLNKSEIKILVNRYKTKELEKYLANEFYTMVKGLFTYIFQEIEKGKQDISPILDKTIDLYKENILVLLPQNKKLHDYIIFKDSMPTNEIDEFLLLKDIVENAKPFLKSKKEFRSIFNTILLKQFAGFSDSHDEIRRIRKSSNFYFAKFIRDNLYRWVELDATVKDLIFSLFENSDKRKSALLINILDTDNFFGLSMSRKFELLAGIRSNESDAYFHKLIKEFSSPKKIT